MKPIYDVYISGPMTGHPNFNFDAFNEAAAKLRRDNYRVFNPAESFGGKQDLQREEYMREDVAALLDSASVVMLPGWKTSKGALLEHAIAVELALPIDYPDGEDPAKPVPKGESVLQEAERLINGVKNQDYGPPKEDFERVAKMWEVVFGVPVNPNQVGLAMICLKVCRHLYKPKRDNLVDIPGYAGCLESCL